MTTNVHQAQDDARRGAHHDSGQGHDGEASGACDACEGCHEPVCGGPKVYRLAIGLFREAAPLQRALTGLADGVSDGVRMCLIGPRSLMTTAEMAEVTAPCKAHFDSLHEQCCLFPDTMSTVATGRLLEELCQAPHTPSASAKPVPHWMTETQFERLGRHVEDGGLVLIVSSGSPAGQDASAHILLRHSQHGVQTHDFTVRPPG